MGGEVVVIHTCVDSAPEHLPLKNNLTAEDACIELSKKLRIGPVARHLFALKFHDKEVWLCPNFLLSQSESTKEFDFRCRFKVPNILTLKKIDSNAFNYYFHQVRSDVMLNKIADISYDKFKRELVGLGVTDMYRVMVEDGVERSVVESDYKKYIPKEVLKHHSFFIKKPIHDSLVSINKGGKHDPAFIKAQYLKQFEEMAPNYLTETYRALTDDGGTPCHVSIKWQQLCTIEDLCYLSARPDSMVEISRRNGIPSYLQFSETFTMFSFISSLDGYYRLMVKWTFNLCKDVITPSLQKLYKLKCHGPVGGEFSYAKLEEKRNNKPGCYILRESETSYDVYYLDVCTEESSKPTTYKITKSSDEAWMFSGNGKSYSSVADFVNICRKKEGPVLLQECLPPTEYDKSPQLICLTNTSKGDEAADGVTNADGMSLGIPLCIDTKTLQVFKGQKMLKTGSMCNVYRSLWRASKGRKVEVALKTLKQEHMDAHLREFLELANRWAFLQSTCIVKLYGVTLTSPVMMVMEYLKLGPLNVYLTENKQKMKPVDLVEAGTYLATGLWHLEEQGVVHGNIRCRKIMVCFHDDSTFKVQLSDPGLHVYSPNEKDIIFACVYWIPVECYTNFMCAQTSVAADVWAFGTTLWEIFSYGESLPEVTHLETIEKQILHGKKLPLPEGCPREVFSLMLECWDFDSHSRKKPQAVMRDINQILYQVFNSRQTHSYAFPKSAERKLVKDPESNTLFSNSSSVSEATGLTFLTSGGEGNSLLSGSSHPLGSSVFQDLSSEFSAGSSLEATWLLKDSQNQDDHSHIFQSGFSPLLPSFKFPNENVSGDSVISMQGIFELDGECNVVLQGRIGQGFYGEVYRGVLERDKDSEPEPIAVKKLKTSALLSNMQDFEREIQIMKSLKHPNIVEIKGIIEEGGGLVMEFVKHGSLLSYLKINKETLTDLNLLKFAMDVAEGMEYLGKKNIVHRDLAARNILVANKNHVKISDFGLAQVMDQDNYYILKTNRELPIKWYAPESLQDGKFSTRSDVWSYGVTLFEMFSRGEDPKLQTHAPRNQKIVNASGKEIPQGSGRDERQEQEALLEALACGTRLPCPTQCSQEIYVRLMLPCWQFQSQSRPSFGQLSNTVRELMDG
ncbi:hypothetical protein J437_LFUL000232 [Ladona fulva]|uniref:Tyrosine-protein kinase n=1 Tax=Ladona fulva TaxID=123851 RepID=A0A8K0NV91_LADFU|nr:hypothetical protein J437_LFUL000232 [Ladona fulva]